MHGLAHQVLPQHGSKCGPAVTTTRARGSARSLQGDVTAPAVAVDEFAQQQGAAIAELRREAAELVPGISLRQWLRQSRHGITGEHSEAGGRGHFVGVQTELFSQVAVQPQQPRRGRAGWARPRIHALEITRVAVVERHVQRCSGRRVGGRIVRGGHVGLHFMLQVLGVFGRRRHMA